MRLKNVINSLNLKPLLQQEINPGSVVKGCYIGDLLSDVMANAKDGELWLTVQTHVNVIAVTHLLNLAGVVFVEGHQPQEETLKKAQEEGILLFGTTERAYELACRLSGCGVGRLER